MTLMVKAATKEVTDDLSAEMRDCMKEEFKSMVSTVKTQYTAMFTHMIGKPNSQDNNIEQKSNQDRANASAVMHQQAPNTPKAMSSQMYAPYLHALYYPNYPHQQPPNVPNQQYWNIHNGQGRNQSSRQTVQMTENSPLSAPPICPHKQY
eukprot:15350973-Ditylum_brightwellii.AAC.1